MTFQIAETAKIHHATAKKAQKLANAFLDDYPVLHLTAVYNEDESQVTGWAVIWDNGEDRETVGEFAKVPGIGDVLEACDAAELDPEALETEEAPAGSVVPDTYREAYKAQENTSGQSNGDWLAVWLEGQTAKIEGFDVDAFQAILDTNEVDNNGKWASLPASGQRGWVGRWRMNGRQQLEKTIAVSGRLWDANGQQVEVPADFVEHMRGKHMAFLNKLAKAAAKAKKAS